MVSTRHHPRPFPEPTLPPSRSPTSASTTSSPTKDAPPSPISETPSTIKRRSASTRRKSSSTPSVTAVNGSAFITPSKTSTSLTRSRSTRRSRSSTRSHFVHTPTSLSITWLLISLPLVIWDTGYVLLRPYTMPGGWLANPIWSPYALYGTVDYIYGFPAWEDKNGFTAAQATLNAFETAAYIYYLVTIARRMEGGFWSWEKGAIGKLWREGRQKELAVKGPDVALAVLLVFSAYVMTLSKTVLYALNEYFSGFKNVGHNKFIDLFFLWVIPNGSWLVFPSIMTLHLGKEILNGMKGNKVE